MGIAQIQSPIDGTEELIERVRGLPPEKRRTLSVELAPRTDAPHRLMRFLAQDEIVIAEPVILESPVLTDEDFCAIARFGSPAHVAKLRQRSDLPQSVRYLLDTHCRGETKLLQELRAGNFDAFRLTLAEIAGTKADGALDALENGDGRPLASACKSAGLSRAAYSSIVLLTDTSRAPEKTESLLFVYETKQGETGQAA